MVFGDKNRFAVEFSLHDDHEKEWLLGYFCYWVNNHIIGDYSTLVSLRDMLFQSTYIMGDCGTRFCQNLILLPRDQIFNLISSALFGESREILQYLPPDFMFSKFNVTSFAHFDWKIFLVEGNDEALILCGKTSNIELKDLIAAKLMLGEFDFIYGEAYNCLNSIYENICHERH
jgi:hypothetical protein